MESNSSGPRARSVERRRCRLPALSPVLAPGPFRFGPGASRGRSSGRSLLASARRSRHGNPRYRSAGIVTLEPWRLLARWLGHTYSGASPDRSCARASRRIGTESNRRGLGRSRQSWIGVCLIAASCHAGRRRSWGLSAPAGMDVRLAWLERPGDAEIAWYARLGTRPIKSMSGGASSAARRLSASTSLIQLTSSASASGSYGCSTSCPRGGTRARTWEWRSRPAPLAGALRGTA